jgi:hypothetical protein
MCTSFKLDDDHQYISNFLIKQNIYFLKLIFYRIILVEISQHPAIDRREHRASHVRVRLREAGLVLGLVELRDQRLSRTQVNPVRVGSKRACLTTS